MTIIASARKTPYGFKALLKFDDGRTRQFRKHYRNREEAIAYAKRYIAANWEGNPNNETSGGFNGLSKEAARWYGR